MKKSTNGTVLDPHAIIDKDITKSKTYDRLFDQRKTNVIEKHNIFKEKELLIMSSISLIWFFTFLYFLLFVFT